MWRKSVELETRREKEETARMYVATHDAVSRVAAVVLTKRTPRPPRLWYLEPDGDSVRPAGLRPGAGLEAAIDKLERATRGANTPSRVRELTH